MILSFFSFALNVVHDLNTSREFYLIFYFLFITFWSEELSRGGGERRGRKGGGKAGEGGSNSTNFFHLNFSYLITCLACVVMVSLPILNVVCGQAIFYYHFSLCACFIFLSLSLSLSHVLLSLSDSLLPLRRIPFCLHPLCFSNLPLSSSLSTPSVPSPSINSSSSLPFLTSATSSAQITSSKLMA